MTSFLSTPPKRILVVTLRYLGDTLLVTPLLNSLKNAFPDAQIDVLLNQNTAAILEGNPAVAHVLTTRAKPSRQENLNLCKQIFRRYDLAICTQAGDRPTLYSVLASANRIGFVPQKNQTGWFKRYLFKRWLEFDIQKTHTVLEILKVCPLLNIEPVYQLTAPHDKNFDWEMQEKYAVLHPMPQWRYKQWTQEGWITVAHFLHSQGLHIVLSGSSLPHEIDYLHALQQNMPTNTLNLAGQLSLAQLAKVIEKATVFVGVDTGITHLAAATKVPIVALFGASDPVKWAPFPANYQSNVPPFVTKGTQHVNNVYLIQGQKDCVPCYLEGCERHKESHSACLNELNPEHVISALADILTSKNNEV